MAKDYYDILGVDESASTQDIKKSYRELAKKYHPDANKSDPSAESRFKEISEAYSVLSNPDKRKKYDQMRKLGAYGQGSGGYNFDSFNFEDLGNIWRGTGSAGRRGGGVNIEDLFGSGGFGLGDILGDLFDQGSRMRRSKGSEREDGVNVVTDIYIPLETVATGGKRTIKITRNETCSVCHGSGASAGTTRKTCPTCGGQGTISMSQGFFAVNRPCPRCFGHGYIIETPCSACNGTGEVKVSRQISITIPAGIEDGLKLRLAEQGNRSASSGRTGDLFVRVHVSKHNFFRRKGNDIYCDVKLDIVHAIKGASIKVKTIHGDKAQMKVPANTQSGRTFKLKGMGIRKKSVKGDQFVTVITTKKREYTAEEQELIDQFESKKTHIET
ncbi:molecular chaperone DnaJ [candidate division KSB1 bacterium]|nr:molecular chaperone DnaJ [candidate division KSB1 bacterium]